MASSLKHFAVETAAAAVAVIGGIEVFFLVFAWPIFIPGREQLMLGWGWIGWIPGGLVGYYAASMFWRLTRRGLSTSEVSTKGRLYGLICLLTIGVVAVLLVNSRSVTGNVNIKWQEEVKMADGNTLMLNRIIKGTEYREKEMLLEVIKLPANWKQPPVWRKEYVPILLDYQPEENIWSAIATFYYCGDREKLGRPKLPYVEYQSRDGGPWEVIPLEERLIGRKTNLLPSPDSGGEPDLITVQEKEKRIRSAADKYRKILAKWHTTC